MNKKKLIDHLNRIILESKEHIEEAHPDDREPDYYEGVIDLAEELVFSLGCQRRLNADPLSFWEL